MQIFIPSRSRFDIKSLTIERIRGGWERDHECFLVVPTNQVRQYQRMPERGDVQVLGCPEDGIARTRHWIGKRAKDKFLMLDDDLRFFFRPTVRPMWDPLPGAGQPNSNPTRLYRAAPEHVVEGLKIVEDALDRYVHVALGPRANNDNWPYPFAVNRRPLRALAYRRKAFLGVEHGRVKVMEDFDVTLQLMRQGHANWLSTWFTQDQYVTNSSGGCSDYRSLEVQQEAVDKMVAMHHPFVKPKLKKNIGGGEFGSRPDVTIYWKKAYESAMKELGLL